MNQTAVEWLVEQLQRIVFYTDEAKENTIQQALEIEKNQIEDSYLQGFAECDATGIMDFEQYYNKTYKTK